jgi:hypothetical protein
MRVFVVTVCVICVVLIAFSVFLSSVVLVCLGKEPYRLGDYVRRVGGFEDSTCQGRMNYLFYRRMQPKNSIVRQYGDKTARANDFPVLAEIIKTREAESASPETLVVHLRLGDVIDNHDRSVDAFISGEYEVAEEQWTDTMNGNSWKGSKCSGRSCKSEGYVKPFSYFEALSTTLPPSVTRIALVSGSHTSTKNPQKSQEYLRRLREMWEQHGFEVEVRWNRPPDDDFAYMSQSKHFVFTGGGFSALVAALVEHFGGTILQGAQRPPTK